MLCQTLTRMMIMDLKTLLAVAIACGLAGCETEPEDASVTIELPEISSSPLEKVGSDAALEKYLKNGLLYATYQSQNLSTTEFVAEDSVVLTGTATAPNTPDANFSSSSFSATNTQEADVDEADRIEYDGDFLYILTRPDYQSYFSDAVITTESVSTVIPEPVSYGLRVMQRDAVSMAEVAWLDLETEKSYQGLYLAGDQLAAIGQESYLFYMQTITVAGDSWYWGRTETHIDVMNVSVPAAISRSHKISIEGRQVATRRLGNKLVVITRHTPALPELIAYPSSDEDVEKNEALIEQASLADLLPTISINDEVSALVSAQYCYLPAARKDNTGYASLTVITSIDLTNPTNFHSACLNTINNGIYVSSQSLYIASYADEEEKTIFHKIDISGDQPVYKASGEVEGVLGRSPSYKMSEDGEFLRVVSSRRDADAINSWWQEHLLSVLKDNQQGELKLVGQIPNQQRTTPVGKPGERVMAVRYFQNRAYIVTFQQIDPFYVVDLTLPEDPRVLGELEIPGFSSYLKPVNENLVLGFGREPFTGSKMSLFDVSDPSTPVELASHVWVNAYAPIEWDPHALAFIENSAGHFRFSFPLSSWSDSGSISELLMFDLAVDESVLLTEAGRLPVMATDIIQPYFYGYNQRSVIHGDEVHYVYDYRVWSASWDLSVINPAQ